MIRIMTHMGDTKIEKTVRDVMHKGVESCNLNTPLRDALRQMSSKGLRSLVVNDEHCALCGILSQTDLVNVSVKNPDTWTSMRAADVMTSDVVTVLPDTPLNDAAKLLIEYHVHRIVVVDKEDPCLAVGVLSMTDIMRDMMGGE